MLNHLNFKLIPLPVNSAVTAALSVVQVRINITAPADDDSLEAFLFVTSEIRRSKSNSLAPGNKD
jgi:hypothetical protein